MGISSSETDNENYGVNQHTQSIISINHNILSVLDEDYCDDEHDNTHKLNDVQDDSFDHSPPLYNGCQFSTIKLVKMLLIFYISN